MGFTMSAQTDNSMVIAQQLQQQEIGQIRQQAQQQVEAPTVTQGEVVQGRPVQASNQAISAQRPTIYPPASYAQGLPTTVGFVPDVSDADMVVLRYRLSVICFSVMDTVLTMINVVSAIEGVVWGLVGLTFLLGPICGFIGARKLKRGLIVVYLAFCLMKTVFELVITF